MMRAISVSGSAAAIIFRSWDDWMTEAPTHLSIQGQNLTTGPRKSFSMSMGEEGGRAAAALGESVKKRGTTTVLRCPGSCLSASVKTDRDDNIAKNIGLVKRP